MAGTAIGFFSLAAGHLEAESGRGAERSTEAGLATCMSSSGRILLNCGLLDASAHSRPLLGWEGFFYRKGEERRVRIGNQEIVRGWEQKMFDKGGAGHIEASSVVGM